MKENKLPVKKRGFIKGTKLEKSILKAKRQFEIIGYALEKPKRFSVGYLADKYRVEDITIMRDLTDLRSAGINIHSVNNQGVEIKGDLNPETIITMIHEYIGLSYTQAPYRAATEYLVSNRGPNAVIILTAIQRAIDTKNEIKIKLFNGKKDFNIKPINIYHNDSEWFLVCEENKIKRLFAISKIKEVTAEAPSEKVMFQLGPGPAGKPNLGYGRVINEPKIIQEAIFEFEVKDDSVLVDDYLEDLINIKVKRASIVEASLGSAEVRDVFREVIEKSSGTLREKLIDIRYEILKRLENDKG